MTYTKYSDHVFLDKPKNDKPPETLRCTSGGLILLVRKEPVTYYLNP